MTQRREPEPARLASEDRLPWINPVGGLGDVLMLSGVLKQVHEQDPDRRFNLVRRSAYISLLRGHPVIARRGFPPDGAELLGMAYWSMEPLGPDEQRPFQILARAFGLQTPVEETLWIPQMSGLEDPVLHDFIPWRELNVVIAPASDSPRKMTPPPVWHGLVHRLLLDQALVLQLGKRRDLHIRNTYSLLGLTTPRQAIALLARCDLLITSDNFLMHAAHLMGTPAVVLWGPTRHQVYGYPEQLHLQLPKGCGLPLEEDCLGPQHNEGGALYDRTCPQGAQHCMAGARPDQVYEVVRRALRRG